MADPNGLGLSRHDVPLDAAAEAQVHDAEVDAEYGVTNRIVVGVDGHAVLAAAAVVGDDLLPAGLVLTEVGPAAARVLPRRVVEPEGPSRVVWQVFHLDIRVAPEGALAVGVDVGPAFDLVALVDGRVDALRVGRRRCRLGDGCHAEQRGEKQREAADDATHGHSKRLRVTEAICPFGHWNNSNMIMQFRQHMAKPRFHLMEVRGCTE